MAQTFTGRKRVRKFFGHIHEVAMMPNLIEVQKASYDQFLIVDEPKGGRPDECLQAVFKSLLKDDESHQFQGFILVVADGMAGSAPGDDQVAFVYNLLPVGFRDNAFAFGDPVIFGFIDMVVRANGATLLDGQLGNFI